jgi:2-dehydropantoate 2-reductase
VRYLIVGAGAVGGTLAARLHEAGRDAVLVARGANLEVLSRRGLELRTPEGVSLRRVPVVASPADAGLGPEDVVVLATKTQDSEAALGALEDAVPADVGVVCAQNGVENERLALRRFPCVYAMRVVLPAVHLEPGVVELSAAPVSGVLDVGRYPAGLDERATAIAADLSASRFDCRADPGVMAKKHAKLLVNLVNALEALCGWHPEDPDWRALLARARAEALECYAAAGIEVAADEDDEARRAALAGATDRRLRRGSSSWQSLERRSGSVEADWLNGEIVLLGRLHGVATPVNELLRRRANAEARARRAPGGLTARELLTAL